MIKHTDGKKNNEKYRDIITVSRTNNANFVNKVITQIKRVAAAMIVEILPLRMLIPISLRDS